MKLQIDLNHIESCYPNAYKDFMNFYNNSFKPLNFLKDINFNSLPFEMQLGIFLRYFKDNAVELDVCNADYEMLPDVITEAFNTQEKVIKHYS
ncbi:MAG: hypothetical protein ACK40G_00355 [Cytophagaceae bacterium]